jgi:hypothetical protein
MVNQCNSSINLPIFHLLPSFSHVFPMCSQVFSQVPSSDLQRQDGIFHVELKYTTSHGAQLIEARYNYIWFIMEIGVYDGLYGLYVWFICMVYMYINVICDGFLN